MLQEKRYKESTGVLQRGNEYFLIMGNQSNIPRENDIETDSEEISLSYQPDYRAVKKVPGWLCQTFW